MKLSLLALAALVAAVGCSSASSEVTADELVAADAGSEGTDASAPPAFDARTPSADVDASACEAPPGSSRRYVGTPSECVTTLLTCSADEHPFAVACGCGCER